MSKKINVQKNPKVLNDFLSYLEDVENLSINTINGYELDLKIFCHFVIQYKKMNIAYTELNGFLLLTIKKEDIYAFLIYLNYTMNNCSTSRKRKLAAVKSFFKWLYTYFSNTPNKNPTLGIHNITPHYRLPKFLTLNQAKELQGVFNKSNSKTYIRDNAILTLFLTTGIRLSELLNINLNDINFNSKTIKIFGKGSKERIVYFTDYCKEKLLNYIQVRKEESGENNALFISSQNKRISKSSIENICKQAYKLVGLEDMHYTVHTLRHTAATIMFESSNRDIVLLKEFLGHATIISTEIYIHTNNNTAREAMNRNPLCEWEEGRKCNMT